MFGECHMHIFMNGVNYREAVQLHKNGVQEADIRKKLEQYKACGITFLRDGGDGLGVSARAAKIAPEYGIAYRTPIFAIHKKGHYGGIVGYGFEDWREYHSLVKQVRAEGGDFIKVMFSGIMDFDREGAGDGAVSFGKRDSGNDTYCARRRFCSHGSRKRCGRGACRRLRRSGFGGAWQFYGRGLLTGALGQ